MDIREPKENLLEILISRERETLRKLEQERKKDPNTNPAQIFHLKYQNSLTRRRTLKDVNIAMRQLHAQIRREIVAAVIACCAISVLLVSLIVILCT